MGEGRLKDNSEPVKLQSADLNFPRRITVCLLSKQLKHEQGHDLALI